MRVLHAAAQQLFIIVNSKFQFSVCVGRACERASVPAGVRTRVLVWVNVYVQSAQILAKIFPD